MFVTWKVIHVVCRKRGTARRKYSATYSLSVSNSGRSTSAQGLQQCKRWTPTMPKSRTGNCIACPRSEPTSHITTAVHPAIVERFTLGNYFTLTEVTWKHWQSNSNKCHIEYYNMKNLQTINKTIMKISREWACLSHVFANPEMPAAVASLTLIHSYFSDK